MIDVAFFATPLIRHRTLFHNVLFVFRWLVCVLLTEIPTL